VQGDGEALFAAQSKLAFRPRDARFLGSSWRLLDWLQDWWRGRSPAGEGLARGEDGAHIEALDARLYTSNVAPPAERAAHPRARLRCFSTSSITCSIISTALNVFRYITVRTAMANLTALLLALVLGPWVIRQQTSCRSASSFGRGAESHQSESRYADDGGY